ncbi:MAG: hypothetical protein HC794_05385, partial [Nitrospiraceae bacterium]|nr:hypothetical protein [Nitrospiraceae bacterium]
MRHACGAVEEAYSRPASCLSARATASRIIRKSAAALSAAVWIAERRSRAGVLRGIRGTGPVASRLQAPAGRPQAKKSEAAWPSPVRRPEAAATRQDYEAAATIRQEVLEGMVLRQVLLQRAEDAGYRVSEARVDESIMSTEAFQVDGRYSEDVAQSLLRAQGISPEGFKQSQREQLT